MRNRFQSGRQNRREFLKKTAVSAVLAVSPFGAVSAQVRRVEEIGLQLYSLRREMADDFEGTLEQLAEIGFTEMEFAGYHGKTPAEVRNILDSFGLTTPASHVPLQAIRDDLDREIETAVTLGQEYMVMPFLPENERSLDSYRRVAELLNRAGEKTREAGITMGYHNHNFEFDIHEGGLIGYDILMSETEPELVTFEMDLFWAEDAGYDAKFFFLKYPGRFPMIHVKDRAGSGAMVDVGRGYIDFQELFSYASKGGFRHYFIEHDNPTDGINSMAYSYNSVRNLRFNSTYELPY
ncbi:MAG TPA: sugar phosphate isomerase/epimerase [Gammaproteobacteria bacterium]|nr:sugar phosphate isomerase/epimerase [Gammaproteobacteria bacterium]|tara:strand:+ start:11479 stop:12360 length:882 start_codon:yes stop_codon:yes gene_type:complete